MSVNGTIRRGLAALAERDGELYALLQREHRRQLDVLDLIAAASPADPSVLACHAASIANTTAEGYPDARYHAGAEVADAVEALAIARACTLFRARHANVQPHSCTSANQAVLLALLRPGDTLLGLALQAGGHLSHGAPVSVVGRLFDARSYGVDASGRIDLDEVRRLARVHRPRVIIAGASAYPFRIDFAAFRAVADEVGAWLLADISHVAGLVAAGAHPSPIDHAHVTTTSTYKQLGGPRGGLILLGRDRDAPAPGGRGTLADAIDRAVFPLLQGTPSFAAIAAKARALELAAGDGFRAQMRRVVENAARLAAQLAARGHRIVGGGSENHQVLLHTMARGLTGADAERALAACRIVVNKNVIPGDAQPPKIAGGIRLGTNTVAAQGMGPDEMDACAALVDEVLAGGDATMPERVRARVAELCARFPLPGYTDGA